LAAAVGGCAVELRMNSGLPAGPQALSIAAVERDTGLSKDTLRVWERRYGFPQPERDALGERSYPLDQVEKLRIIKRLLDAGHRPGRVVGQPVEALDAMAEALGPSTTAPPPGQGDEMTALMDAVYAHDVDRLRRLLAQRLAALGLSTFVHEVVAPFNRLVGEAWLRGRMQVFEEHAYTESLQVVLRHALHALPRAGQPARPVVVLSTFPGEQHSLGLLMVESLLTLEGCHCVSLGVQTPIWDLVLAAEALKADVVVLSFSGVMNPNVVLEGLQELRGKLPATVSVWAGGSASIIQRRPVTGVEALGSLHDLKPALARWRERQA